MSIWGEEPAWNEARIYLHHCYIYKIYLEVSITSCITRECHTITNGILTLSYVEYKINICTLNYYLSYGRDANHSTECCCGCWKNLSWRRKYCHQASLDATTKFSPVWYWPLSNQHHLNIWYTEHDTCMWSMYQHFDHCEWEHKQCADEHYLYCHHRSCKPVWGDWTYWYCILYPQ